MPALITDEEQQEINAKRYAGPPVLYDPTITSKEMALSAIRRFNGNDCYHDEFHVLCRQFGITESDFQRTAEVGIEF